MDETPPDAARWATLQTLLDDALDLAPTERAAFIARAAGDDHTLAAELAALLDAADAVPAFLDAEPAWSLADDAPEDDLAGRRVGPYRIVHELGRGGQGRVFLAERDDVGSRVALKLLRGGLAAPDLLRRFLTERRVLAGLGHPHIARLLDAGALDGPAGERTPYFVMEAVEGEPITAYVRHRQLAVEDRLALFLQVCDAVAFAHRRLVVHRDLKPSNVLVAFGEGTGDMGAGDGRLRTREASPQSPVPRPTVKLLDFGIAKLLDESDRDGALTQTGHRLLTPEYAAPEQVLGQEVTVATDVYALGVLLYELLADARPYDTAGGLRAVIRAVCDEMPPPPSVRTADPDRARRLRGDLDTITCRALAKAPEARYATVDALADDLRRQRDGLPVRARAQTLRYRAAKFVRRHAVGVGMATLVAGLAVAFVVRERALRVEAEAARTEAQATADLLLDVFGASADQDGEEIRPDTLRAEILIDRASRRLDGRLGDQPALKAALTLRVGSLYNGLRLFTKAEDRFRAAERLARQSGDAAVLADALGRVGEALVFAGRCQEGLAPLDEAMRLQADAAPVLRARALESRGTAAGCLGRYDEAVANLQEAQAVYATDPDDRGFTLHSLADFLNRAGRPGEAIATLDASIARAGRFYPPGHSVPTARRDMLSVLLTARGDLAGAERVARRAYEDARSRHAPSHNRTMGAELRLAHTLRLSGQLDEAERHTTALVGLARGLPASDVVIQARVYHAHALVLLAAGRPHEAEASVREALAVPDDPVGNYLVDRVVQYRTLRDALAQQGQARAADVAEQNAVAVEREIEARRHAD